MQTLTLKTGSDQDPTGNQIILMDALIARAQSDIRLYRFWCTDLSTNTRYGLVTTSKDVCLKIASLLEMGLIALCAEIDIAFQRDSGDCELLLTFGYSPGISYVPWKLFVTKTQRSATVDQLYTLASAH